MSYCLFLFLNVSTPNWPIFVHSCFHLTFDFERWSHHVTSKVASGARSRVGSGSPRHSPRHSPRGSPRTSRVAMRRQDRVPKQHPGVVELENEMRMTRDESMCWWWGGFLEFKINFRIRHVQALAGKVFHCLHRIRTLLRTAQRQGWGSWVQKLARVSPVLEWLVTSGVVIFQGTSFKNLMFIFCYCWRHRWTPVSVKA